MSFNPADGPISAPTTFPRSVGTGMPPGGSQTNGVPTNLKVLESLPHLGGIQTTTLYDRAAVFGQEGANSRIIHKLYKDKTDYKEWHTGTKQLLFVKVTSTGYKNMTEEYEMIGVSMLNHQLMFKPSMYKYAIGRDASRFMADYHFAGCQIKEENSYRDPQDHMVQAMVISRSAITYSLWSAIKHGQSHRGAVREGDVLWFIITRVKKFNELDSVFSESKQWVVDAQTQMERRARKRKAVDGDVYDEMIESRVKIGRNNEDAEERKSIKRKDKDWRLQILPWVSTARERPPTNLYIEDDSYDPVTEKIIPGFVGDAIMIGRVQALYRNHDITLDKLKKARNALCPRRDDKSYLADLLTLPEVNVMLCLG